MEGLLEGNSEGSSEGLMEGDKEGERDFVGEGLGALVDFPHRRRFFLLDLERVGLRVFDDGDLVDLAFTTDGAFVTTQSLSEKLVWIWVDFDFDASMPYPPATNTDAPNEMKVTTPMVDFFIPL